MRTALFSFSLLITIGALLSSCKSSFYQYQKDDKEKILEQLTLANDYFMNKWPDVTKEIVNDKVRPSNIWTRAVYYEGLMELYKIDPQDRYLQYATDWGEYHKWRFRGDQTYTRYADHHCAAQTYLDLYQIAPQPERIAPTIAAIDSMMRTDRLDDWSWIDAIQMALPVFLKLGKIQNNPAYYQRGLDMYLYSKNKQGDNGLYNPEDQLWWRDADFDPPYTSPNGEDCYWSRGNGWVIMALARAHEILPNGHPHREIYAADLQAMAKALIKVQRADGFWNVSLHDPNEYGGKETSGTAMFVYGMAYGIRAGLLDESTFLTPVIRGWEAMANEALHDNGFLGYAQSTGKEPKDGQPLSYDKVPNFEDYTLGAFLCAGTELYRLKSTL